QWEMPKTIIRCSVTSRPTVVSRQSGIKIICYSTKTLVGKCQVQKILYHWLGYRIGLLNIIKAKTLPLFGNKAAVQKTTLACSFLTGQAAVTSRTRSFLTGQLSTAQD